MHKKQNRPGKEIVKLLKEGMIPKDIKDKLKVSGTAVSYWTRKLNMPFFKRGRPFRGNGPRNKHFKTDARKIAKEMRASGSTFSEIGKALGVKRQRAHQYFLTAD